MAEDVFLPRRRSVRLPQFDYSNPTAYFVTICSQDMRRIFGKVIGSGVALSPIGEIVDRCWREVPTHFPSVELGPCVVMPNHLHGVIKIQGTRRMVVASAKHSNRAQHAVPLRVDATPRRFGEMVPDSVAVIVRSFKSAVTMEARKMKSMPKLTVWQRGYYEHVIRNEEDMRETCEYIRMNPARWQFDENNRVSAGRDRRVGV